MFHSSCISSRMTNMILQVPQELEIGTASEKKVRFMDLVYDAECNPTRERER